MVHGHRNIIIQMQLEHRAPRDSLDLITAKLTKVARNASDGVLLCDFDVLQINVILLVLAVQNYAYLKLFLCIHKYNFKPTLSKTDKDIRHSPRGKAGALSLIQVTSEVRCTRLPVLLLPPISSVSLSRLFNMSVCSSRKSS